MHHWNLIFLKEKSIHKSLPIVAAILNMEFRVFFHFHPILRYKTTMHNHPTDIMMSYVSTRRLSAMGCVDTLVPGSKEAVYRSHQCEWSPERW